MDFADLHIHTRAGARVKGRDVLKSMDAVGMTKAVLISAQQNDSDATERAAIDQIAGVVKTDRKRLVGFAWIEPTVPGAVERVTYAIEKQKLRGIKMIPNHWYPYEERLFPVYKRIEELRVPLLFHSGILYGNGDSSRFCRPCYFEVMLHFPKVKFALAHIGWPWTDECIATFGRMRAAVGYKNDDCQMYIDTTRGTPRYYRTDALRKALLFAGPDRIIYGSDDSIPSPFTYAQEGALVDRDIITGELGFPEEACQKILRDNLDDFLKPLA
jgi:uncharacterized protein